MSNTKQTTVTTKIVLEGAESFAKESELTCASLKKIETTLISVNEQLDKMKNHLAQLSCDRN